MASWKLDVVCANCGYVAASTPIGMGTQHDDFAFRLEDTCPACDYEAGRAPKRRPSRFYIWREQRRFRRQLQATHPSLDE